MTALSSDLFAVMTSLHSVPVCHVYRTQLANRTCELLLVEDAPINDMVFDSQSSALWVATASSCVRRCLPQHSVNQESHMR